MSNCTIMQRMKENYENRAKTFLIRRIPVIIRIDGKAFHTYTKGLHKPFDEGFIEDMIETTKFLCANIQGAKCGYTQSDEISILVTDYDDLQTQAWFDYSVQKICSVSASLTTGIYNQIYVSRKIYDFMVRNADSNTLIMENMKIANFDSRCFNIPKEEVANYFYARQKDATKNSISMLAQSLFSHKELHGFSGNQMQEKMLLEKGVNWNDLSYNKKRGSFIVKQEEIIKDAKRTKWNSVETPIKFTNEHFEQWL